MPDDDQPAPLPGHARMPGHLDLPDLLAEAILAEAEARNIPWQDVVARAVSDWELARQRRRRGGRAR